MPQAQVTLTVNVERAEFDFTAKVLRVTYFTQLGGFLNAAGQRFTQTLELGVDFSTAQLNGTASSIDNIFTAWIGRQR